MAKQYMREEVKRGEGKKEGREGGEEWRRKERRSIGVGEKVS